MASCALLAIGLQFPLPGRAACAIKVMELPVTMVGSRAIATLGLNGTNVPLMVDSGAFFSMLTEATAAQLKLRLHPMPHGMEVEGLLGRIVAHATTVEHLDLLKGQLSEVDFVVGGNEPGAGAMGLIGRNILSFTDTEYDLAHGVIRFVFPSDDCENSNMAYWAGNTPVAEIDLLHEFRARTPAIRAAIQVNGKKVTALFDTGATTSVSLRAAHRAGVKDGDMKPSGQIYGGSLEKADAWTAAFDRIELGGEAVLHNRLEVADFDMREADMLVGIDFFLSHRIYVSKKQSKMYFTYNGGPVFALNVGDKAAEAGQAGADAMDADAHARRGAASLARGDLQAALADLDRACALEPGTASFFSTRASVQRALRQADKARADLDTALRLDPGQASARIERAWMRFGAGEREPALEDLSVLDKTLPGPSQIRQSMAHLYGTLDLPAQALAQWNLWIPTHPHEITRESAYNGRCWARVELGTELDKALDDCDEAVDADSRNPSYLDSRAWVYLRLGKLQKALADFDRGLALRPTGTWSLYGRALVHLRLGETAPGQSDLASARQQEHGIDEAVRRAGLPVAPAATP
jgi:tetratricopeptide (TPR) repeat protein/predicted aspartyl protease